MLLLQTAYLTAIAVLVEKQSAVQANSQHEKWVCTAAGVSISHWGGLLLLLRELHLLHSKAVIVAPISVENTHLHPSIPTPQSPLEKLEFPSCACSIQKL